MSIVGFSFTKLHGEKKRGAKGKINIKNHIAIQTITDKDVSISSKDDKALKFEFEFSSTYEPDLGNISIHCALIDLQVKEKAEHILEEWKSEKKLSQEIAESLYAYVLRKCNIKAMILADELNLPNPIPLREVIRPK